MAPVGGVSISDLLAGYVALPSVAVTAQAAWTLEGRVRLRALPANLQALAAEASSANSTSVMLGVNSSGFPVLLAVESGGGAGNITGTVNLADGAEHHLAATLAGTVLSLFADGVLVATVTKPGTFAPNTTTIGARRTASVDRVLNGRAAGVRLWTRALTAAEIADRSLGREISRTGLVADLPLDEGTGTKALDRSDVPLYDGALTGAIAWLQPKAARGLRSSGTGGRVDALLPAAVAQVAFSAVARVRNARITDTAYASILNVNGAASGPTGRALLQRYATADALLLQMGTGPGQIQILSVGKWAGDYHVALTFDGATARGYQDGALIGSAAGTVTPGAILPDVTFGGGTSGQDFSVGDVAYYSRALSALEIRAIMLGADPLSIEGCVGYFPLDGDTLNRAGRGSVPRNRLVRTGVSTSFEADAAGWTAYQGTALRFAGAGTNGVASLLCVSTAPTDTGAYTTVANRPPVVPGETITLGVDVAGPGGPVLVRPSLQFVNAGGGNVGGPIEGAGAIVTPDGWTRVTVTATVPATATVASAFVRMPFSLIGDRFLMDSVVVVGGADGSWVPDTQREVAAAVQGRAVNSPRLVRPRAAAGLRLLRAGSQYANVPQWAFGSASASIACLYRHPSPGLGAGNEGLLNLAPSGTYSLLLYRFTSDGSVRLTVPGASDVIGPNLDDGALHLLVGTYVGGVARLYVDGILYATVGGGSALAATLGVDVGRYAGSQYADAQIADARVWSRALEADEIAALQAGVVTRFGLEGEWLTDGSVGGGVALDTSGKGRHGSVVGAVAA